VPWAWAACAAAFGCITAPLEPNVLEEGIVVHTAERMLHGEHLYRDVVSHTAPLPYEVLALGFRLLGPDLWVARALVVALQALGGGLTYAFTRRAGAGAWAHAAAAAIAVAPVLLIPLFSTYFYTTLAFYLGLAAVYTALRSAEAARWAVLTGVLLALVALCKQTLGLVAVVAFGGALAATLPASMRARRLAGVAAGGAVVTLATFALYAARGDLDAFVYSQLQLAWLMGRSDTFGTPFINLWPPGRLSPVVRDNWVMYLPSLYHLRHGLFTVIGWPIVLFTQLLYALPFAVLAGSAVRAARGRLAPAGWIHAAFLVTMVANLYPRPDWGHLVVALPPALVQIALLAPVGRAPGAQRPARGAAPLLSAPRLAAAWVAVLFALAAGLGTWLHELAGPATFGPRVPLEPVSRAHRSPAFPRVIHYLRRHTNPGEAIFVARQEPLLYYATGTRNPTPFEGVLQGVRELQERRIVEALEDVRYVVMSDIDQPLYTYYSEQLPEVWAYLERYFRIPPDFPLDDASWITVAERGPDRGRTAIDLHERQGDARAWIRDPAGREVPREGRPQKLAARHYRRPLPVALGAGGGGLDFRLEVPPDAVFQADVGYRGLVSIDHQYIHPPGTTAVVSLRPEDADRFTELLAVRIPDGPRAGRRWRPVQADLSAWAGQRVTLRLEFRTREPLRPGRRLAWFGSPRIAVPAPPADAAPEVGP